MGNSCCQTFPQKDLTTNISIPDTHIHKDNFINSNFNSDYILINTIPFSRTMKKNGPILSKIIQKKHSHYSSS